MVDLKREQELRSAIELMFFAYRAFTSGPDRILEKRGLNRTHHRLLYFVGRDPGLSVNELLKILQISKQALNAPLRQLITMNLVINYKSKSDGRVRQLKLSAEGKKLESRLSDTQLLQLEEVFVKTGKTAETGWKEVMQKLAED